MQERTFAERAQEQEYRKNSAYQEFERFVEKRILNTRHLSPQRYALNDWFGLLQATSEVTHLQSAIDAAKAFGREGDPALPDDLEDAKVKLKQARKVVDNRTAQYKTHLIELKDRTRRVEQSPYDKTISYLNDRIYPKLFHAEREIIVGHGALGIYTPDEVDAMAMGNVVEAIPGAIKRVQERPVPQPRARKRK